MKYIFGYVGFWQHNAQKSGQAVAKKFTQLGLIPRPPCSPVTMYSRWVVSKPVSYLEGFRSKSRPLGQFL